MAGVEKLFEGVAVPMPGASIGRSLLLITMIFHLMILFEGYLPQEPALDGLTVMDNINLGVKAAQDLLERFNELSAQCADPSLQPEEMEKVRR